jgi:hypothetical protein
LQVGEEKLTKAGPESVEVLHARRLRQSLVDGDIGVEVTRCQKGVSKLL